MALDMCMQRLVVIHTKRSETW